MYKQIILLFCSSSLALTSCYRQATKIVVPMEVVCTTAYRGKVYSPHLPMNIKQSVSLSATNPEAEIALIDLVFQAMYYKGPPYEERFLKVSVTTTDSKDELLGVLYQLSPYEILENQIISHGFTGLHYVYNPVTRSELQFWCTAE